MITPPDEEKEGFAGYSARGAFKLCLDETGHSERVVVLGSTGLPGYDARIIRTMTSWTFRPFLIDNQPAPVCTAFTFIYTQP